MPRARNIKPAFFKDAKVVSCSFAARLLFEGMWCIADYKGRFKYVPIEVKMELFAADDVNIDELTGELVTAGLIEKYTDRSGSTLVQVLGFEKHQNPHQNERFTKDKKPAPCLPSIEECLSYRSGECEEKPIIKQDVEKYLVALREWNESNPADSLFLIPDSLSLIPDSSKPDSGKKPEPVNKESEQVQLLFEFWQKVMNKSNVKLSTGRKSKITARLKDYSFDEIYQAIENCSKSKFHMGMNDNNKQYNDIELICRNCEKLESFRDMPVISDQLQNFSSQEQRNIINSQEWLNEQ